jgi:hypothetical protein
MQLPREVDLAGGVGAAEEEWGASAEALAVPAVVPEVRLAVEVGQVVEVPAVGVAGSSEVEEALAAEVGEVVAEPAAGRAIARR